MMEKRQRFSVRVLTVADDRRTAVSSGARPLVCLVCVVIALLGAAPASAAPVGIVELPVRFTVTNKNTSKVPCAQTDGKTYEIVGHLVAPAAVLSSAAPAVTLYLHGAESSGDLVWRFDAVPEYDFALELANAGHASVVIDRLGYAASGDPNGKQVCLGSSADAVHQLIAQLRSGSYRAPGPRPEFKKVALGGHSLGAYVTQIVAYSWPDDVDALIVMSAADETTSLPVFLAAPRVAKICADGGQPKYDDGTYDGGTGPMGYVHNAASREELARADFYDADPRVVEAAMRQIVKTPCGENESAGTTITVDQALVPTITEPVLLVFGDKDAIYPPPAGEQQYARYVGSTDRTLITLEETGHLLMLERSAPLLRERVSEWLARRGF